jgi:hypothetical protein
MLVANAERVDLAPRGTEMRTGRSTGCDTRLPLLLVAGMLQKCGRSGAMSMSQLLNFGEASWLYKGKQACMRGSESAASLSRISATNIHVAQTESQTIKNPSSLPVLAPSPFSLLFSTSLIISELNQI